MIGAIAGDIIGSVYEFNPYKVKDFPLFGEGCQFTDYFGANRGSCPGHPDRRRLSRAGSWGSAGAIRTPATARVSGDGSGTQDPRPYYSFGNGSAMRVSPIGYALDTRTTSMTEAQRSAEVTHNHPEGIKGAQAIALAVFLARKDAGKDELRREIEKTFGYDLHRHIKQIRKSYTFDVSCQGSVPEAIIAFLDSEGVEDAIRLGVSLGGDADTLACITGGIAEAFYGPVPADIREKVQEILNT